MPFYSTCDEEIQLSVLKTTKTVLDIQELYRENAYLKDKMETCLIRCTEKTIGAQLKNYQNVPMKMLS